MFFLGSSCCSRWIWEAVEASQAQTRSLGTSHTATTWGTETKRATLPEIHLLQNFLDILILMNFSGLNLSQAHLPLAGFSGSHPVFSPKCCSSWILLNWVRSPMFSTRRVSVMDFPSFPPRLRLKSNHTCIYSPCSLLWDTMRIKCNIIVIVQVIYLHFPDGKSAEEFWNGPQWQNCLAIRLV